MSAIIKKLQSDHRHMSMLMGMIEAEIESFNEGGTVDYEFMEDILRYMVTYSDQDHHPTEELISKKLMEDDPESVSSVGNLSKAHEELAKLGESFLSEIQLVLTEETMSRDWFITKASDYLNSLTGHMKYEELVMFPLSLRILSVQDWEEIEIKVNLSTDPLLLESDDQEFKTLRQKVLSVIG